MRELYYSIIYFIIVFIYVHIQIHIQMHIQIHIQIQINTNNYAYTYACIERNWSSMGMAYLAWAETWHLEEIPLRPNLLPLRAIQFLACYNTVTGWWFGTCFIFPYFGNNHPNWLIFFRRVETTNQYWL